jgi:benzylsuccinate CoA-transferase BbsE subunit
MFGSRKGSFRPVKQTTEENSQQGSAKVDSILAPYRVLDLTDAKGFLCGKILGDLGADVIKIEKPGGDPDRNIGPFYRDIADPEKSLHWFAYNTSKRSITLNIEATDGKEIFKRLVKRADFVLESFPPGYLTGLGLDYPVLRELNPRLIITSITPFGQTGPYRDYKSSDLVASAMGGLVYTCGDADRPPVRISVEQAYLHAGVHAAGGSLMAHYFRELTGLGQHVDVSIEEAMVWTTMYTVPYWYTAQRLFPRSGNLQTRYGSRYRLMFPCKDGYVSVKAYTGLTFGPWQARLVKAMADEGVAGDLTDVDWEALSFEGQPKEEIDHWEEIMLSYFMKHTKAELHEKAREYEFSLFPSNTPKDVIEYCQLTERNFWVEIEHPELAETLRYPGDVFKSELTLDRVMFRAPLIGEHNEEIYGGELGFSKSELVTLKEANVI